MFKKHFKVKFRLDAFIIFLIILCAKFKCNVCLITTTETNFQLQTVSTNENNELITTIINDDSDFKEEIVTGSTISTEVEDERFDSSVDSRKDFVTDRFSIGTTERDEESTTVFTTEEITTQSLCQSVPEELKNIKITHKANNIYKLNWGKPASEDCNRYQISISGVNTKTTKIIDTNSIELDNISSLYCTRVDIAAVDIMNNTGNGVTRLIPGPVTDLTATVESYQITLNWVLPADTSCIEKYVIYLNDKENTEVQNDITTATLQNLEACTNHKIEVFSISNSGDKSEGNSIEKKTSKPEKFDKTVENLQLKTDSRMLYATWDPPELTGACVTVYTIRVWRDGGSTIDSETKVTNIKMGPFAACGSFTFQIYSELSANLPGNECQEKFVIAEDVSSPPQIKNIIEEKTSIQMRATLDTYDVNMCTIKSTETICTFSGENLLDWMVEKVEQTFDYNDSPSRPIQDIVVEGLSPFTDYICNIFVNNQAGKSEPTEIKVKTIEDVPSEPLNLKATPEEDKIGISWDEPVIIPGILKEYKLNVKYKESKHFIPESCEINKGDIIDDSVNGNNYFFELFLPNSIYNVNIQAQTGAGFGKEASIEFLTSSKPSEAIRSLDKTIEINDNTNEYDVTIKIVWKIPCNTNGNLIKFICKIEGVKLENQEPLEIQTEEIKPNEDIKNEDYTFEMINVKPYVEYTVTIFAVTSGFNDEVEINGEITTVVVLSPEGRPSAPQSITIDEITSDKANIHWKEPTDKNGKIINYQINIDSIRPLHPVNNIDCETTHNDSLEVEGDALNYQYGQFWPNYEYDIGIKAKTSSGYGGVVKATFQTLTAQSEIVGSIETKISFGDTDDYNVTLVVDFIEPCHLNGNLDYYKLTLNGTRSGFTDHFEEMLLEEYVKDGFEVSLKPEYTYNGFIEVYTEKGGFISERRDLDVITSLAGIPKEATSKPTEPYSIESESVKFDLDKEIFSNEMGEILYYAIILAPEDYNPQKNYDITNGNWSDTGKWDGNGDLKEYQTTPKEWNPFVKNSKTNRSKGDRNKISNVHTFEIGTENCKESNGEYCNGPLRPDTSYSLRVRGFTSFGYRDTVKVSFLTPSKLNYGALIGGIVGGGIGLLLLFIIIIIFWRRRRTKEKEEDTALETMPVVPPPIPINKFPDHYNDYKNNLNKLKSEYTLLERMGVSEQLPMTFAMTDDNKRKNRYINVLPYDETRVKLDRDKNDNYADYINASFIKGYSGNVEYIATQGPLESTVVDFWRMVIQENVAVIVMVAQFVEHEKAKCHQYFPNNRESMTIGDGIEIRCANEVPLGGYIKRTLMVQRELMQITITHLQYIQWPDFGCPNDAHSMLDFCNVLRQCVEQYKSKTIIHCSAGVGRTGTLIALDILLQTIENAGDIDIFKTVLNLRKQRIRMVQTEKQYMYIHNCLAEYILNPSKSQIEEAEPIYENVTKKNETKDIP